MYDVTINLDMLQKLMESRIMSKIYGRSVVVVDGCWFVETNVKIFEEVVHPLDFTCEGGNCSMYSGLELERDSVVCFFDFYKIGDFPRKNAYLVTGVLVVGQVAQSLSAKPKRIKSESEW